MRLISPRGGGGGGGGGDTQASTGPDDVCLLMHQLKLQTSLSKPDGGEDRGAPKAGAYDDLAEGALRLRKLIGSTVQVKAFAAGLRKGLNSRDGVGDEGEIYGLGQLCEVGTRGVPHPKLRSKKKALERVLVGQPQIVGHRVRGWLEDSNVRLPTPHQTLHSLPSLPAAHHVMDDGVLNQSPCNLMMNTNMTLSPSLSLPLSLLLLLSDDETCRSVFVRRRGPQSAVTAARLTSSS